MIRDKYRVPGKASGRYVRKASGQPWYEWCEQNAEEPQYDIAQGTCDAEDLPEQIRKACDEATHVHYTAIWPMDSKS